MSTFITNIKSSRIIMKILMKYTEYFQQGSYFSYFLLLIKYIPLIIITHEWKTIQNFGLFQLVGKFCISNYIEKETSNILIFIFFNTLLFLNLFSVFLFYISYRKLKFFETKSKAFKKYMHNSLHILNLLNFSFVQYFYEILILMPLKFWSKQTNEISSDYQADVILRISSIFISLFYFVLIISQNFIFALINFRPYFIKKTFYSGKLNSFNSTNILFPLISVVIAAENFGNFEIILVIKIVIRCIFCIYYLKNLLNFDQKIFYLEFFISSFCFVSCIVEFVFINDFLSINNDNTNLADLIAMDPIKFSLLYANYFFYTKIFLEFLFSAIFWLLIKTLERNFSSNFFVNIKSNKFFSFYNIIFELTNSLMQKGQEKKSIELCLISQKMNNHIETCNISDCLCSDYKSLLKNISNSQEKKFNQNIFLEIILNLLNKNLKKFIKQNKYTNSEDFCKYLMLQTIYMLYFKKHYAKCFFNIEKISLQEFYKKNYFFRVQIFFLKYEVIIDFINFNKTSKNSIFKKMRLSYEKYNKYKNLEFSFLRILENYKNLISLFYSKNNVSFSEYYFHIANFCKEIETSNKKIKYILTTDDQHSSIHIRKIDYIANFLNGENKFIPYNKLSQYLNKTHDDKSDKLIVKHTAKKEFIIDYISSNMAEQLGLKTKDFIGFDFHRFMMTTQFAEIHYQHIVNHIKNNKLLIRNKEIYLPDKDGYVQNFEVDGSILITLSGEILVFVESFSINNDLKEKNISFISCDEEGEILALSKEFTDNFYIDINVKNIVQPNLFKGILNLNKKKLNFENEVAEINYPYKMIISNIRAVDYSKLWDYKPSLYFAFLEKMNIDKYHNEDKIEIKIRITRRNLQAKYFFYDLKISIILEGNNRGDLKKFSYNKTPTGQKPFNPVDLYKKIPLEKNHMMKIVRDRTNNALSIKKVKNFSIFLRTVAGKTQKEKANININNLSSKENNFNKMKKKLNEIEDKSNAENYQSYSIYRMVFFIFFILGFFIYLSSYTKSIMFQVELFAKMKLNFYSLQQENYNIINSIFSLNLVSGGILPKTIFMKNLNFSSTLDNSIDYHLVKLKKRRDSYQENFVKIHDYYLFLNDYLMKEIGLIFENETNIKRLGFNWGYLEKKEKAYEILEFEYRGISKIISSRNEVVKNLKEIKNNDNENIDIVKVMENTYTNAQSYFLKYLLYEKGEFLAIVDYPNNAQKKEENLSAKITPPNLGDIEIFYFLENSLFGLRDVYTNIRKDLNILFSEMLSLFKIRLLIIFLVISSVIIIFFIIEGFIFYNNYKKVLLNYFILFNILKYFMNELYLKIELLEELFIDFTLKNRRKYNILSNDNKFLQKKLQSNDTLKDNFNDIKNRINFFSDKNNNNTKKAEEFPINNFGLLDFKAEENFDSTKEITNNKKIGFMSEIITDVKKKENNIDDIISKNRGLNNLKPRSNLQKDNLIKLSSNKKLATFNINNIDDNNKIDDDNNPVNNRNLIDMNEMNFFNNNINNNEILNSEFSKKYTTAENFLKFTEEKNQIKELKSPNTTNKNKSKKKSSTRNNIDINKDKDSSINNPFNKTDANLINKNDEKEEFKMHDDTGNKKLKSFYIMFYLYWFLLFLIIVLIIINIENTTQVFEKILKYDSTAVIFYRRILIFSEILLIYQMSIFKKTPEFLMGKESAQNPQILLEEIYQSHQINLINFSKLNMNTDPLSQKIKELETNINQNGNFCNFISIEKFADYKGNDKAILQNEYLTFCQTTSQKFFSVGFSEASLNLFNYMRAQNSQLIDYFKDLKISGEEFSKEKTEYYLNDFYYLFCFVNHDRIITDLISILDKQIEKMQSDFFISLEEFHEFIFYLLYFSVIAIGLFSIYKTKYLIHDSFILINNVTEIVENSIKFTDLQEK